jgi:hypothetical protein
MATRFYLHNVAAPYTPATIRGAWDATASAVTKALDTAKRPTSAITYVSIAETSTTDEWDVLLGRFVSGPLKAATIGTGTVDVMLGVYQNSLSANDHYHLHIFVTAGDSDTVRGTLLSDYREAAGVNEWTNSLSANGKALNSAQALSSVAVSDGDRIVVEIGYTARNTSATSYNGRLYYGAGSDGQAGDLTASGDGSTFRGYIQFSEDLGGGPSTVGRVTQGAAEIGIDEDVTPAARVAQGAVEVVIESTGDAQRVTQVVVEYPFTRTATTERLSQLVVEVLSPVVVPSRLTQFLVEIANGAVNETRVTQEVVEILGRQSTYCGDPQVSFAPLCGKADVLAWLEWTVPMKES